MLSLPFVVSVGGVAVEMVASCELPEVVVCCGRPDVAARFWRTVRPETRRALVDEHRGRFEVVAPCAWSEVVACCGRLFGAVVSV